MNYFVIGVIKNNGRTVGFRVFTLDIATKQKEMADCSYSKLFGILKNPETASKFKNVKVDKGRIVGVNGKLDRYGTIDINRNVTSNAIVILRDVVNTSGRHTGYLVASASGDFTIVPDAKIIIASQKFGIANGKVVTKNGSKYICPIEGTYDTYTYDGKSQQSTAPSSNLGSKENKEYAKQDASNNTTTVTPTPIPSQTPTTAPVVQNQQSTDTASTVDPDKERYEKAKKVIAELRTYRSYFKSFAFKIENTINRFKRCSEKQLKCLEEELDKLKKEDAPQIPSGAANVANTNSAVDTNSRPVDNTNNTNITSQSTQTDNQNSNGEPKKSFDDVGKDKSEIEYVDVADDSCFDYTKMNNNKIYIKGFKGNKRAYTVNIPDTVVINGKTYKVEGITIGAFRNTCIKHVKTGKYISDIGQGAFQGCSLLEDIDLSESKHSMIPAYMCDGCTKLKIAAVGKELERIHEFAFGDCTKLETIVGLEKVETIARCAFLNCHILKELSCKTKVIGEKAFLECYSLNKFNFNEVSTIGSYAFRATGFTTLELPGNIREIGDKAFADCALLSNVVIKPGMEVIKSYAFAKSEDSCNKCRRFYSNNGFTNTFVELQEVRTCKSIKDIGADAFRHVKIVYGYTGTPVEAHCLGFGVPFVALDSVTDENSSKVRFLSNFMGADSVDTVYKSVMGKSAGGSNPASYELRKDKLISLDFTGQLSSFGLTATTEQKDPHIKFKAAVNYLQDMTDLYKDPLTEAVLRLQKAMYINSTAIYDDGCNRIYKATFTIMDTLEEGSFIIVIMDNKLVYLADVTVATNIEMNNVLNDDDSLGIKRYLHKGDKIGVTSVISGASCVIKDPETGSNVNFGKILYDKLMDNAIIIKPSKGERWLYVPCAKTALKLFDYKKDENTANSKVDSYSVVAMEDYPEFIKEMKKLKKSTLDNKKFFDQIKSMTNKEVKRKVADIAVVEEEKEAQLFQVSIAFNKLLEANGMTHEKFDPNILTLAIFNELSRSYWMVSKDIAWFRQNGAKSLNKVAEYKIEDCMLIEYKSNQIVKFSNPYMNGQKGAHVFVLKKKDQTLGIYASRYNFEALLAMLGNLTYIPTKLRSDTYIQPITDAYSFDTIDYGLFYKFYDVMYSTNDWNMKNYAYSYNSIINNSYTSFGIYMYKPTGIFYLAMETYALQKQNSILKSKKETDADKEKRKYGRFVFPILPIGNMDRALIVATTTNNNTRKSAIFNELLVLSLYIIAENHNIRMPDVAKELKGFEPTKYCEARQLVIDGEKSTEVYKKLISDRAVYMLGTVHKGKLQREFGDGDEEDIDIDDIEFEYEDEDDTDYTEDYEYDDEDDTDYVEDYEYDDEDDSEYEEEEYEDDEYVIDETEEDEIVDFGESNSNASDSNDNLSESSIDEESVEYMDDDIF